MAGEIQFDEEVQQPQRAYEPEKKDLLVRMVLATGIVSDDKGAQMVLLGVAVTATIIAIALPVIFL